MIFFREKRCMSFSWDSQGGYYGVLAQRRGERVAIRRTWHEQASDQATISEMLAKGIATLGENRDIPLIVGGNVSRVFFHELVLPAMSPENLARALEFEIAKLTPSRLEDIHWNYRDVGPAEGEQRLIRLLCMPADEWQRWIEGASGLGRGVDVFMPASAALDPILAERQVCLSPEGDDALYLLEPRDGGGRSVRLVKSPMEVQDAFGLGPRPLACERLTLGELDSASPEQARGFAPAVVLAMYGLSRRFASDRKQTADVPRELRPRRHGMLKAVAAMLVLYLIAALAFMTIRSIHRSNRQIGEWKNYDRQLKAELARYSAGGDVDARLVELKTALLQAILSRKSVPDALVELTTSLDHRVFARRLSWSDGKLNVYLTAKTDSPDTLLALSQSDFFDKYTLVKRESTGNMLTYQVDLEQKDYFTRGEEVLNQQRSGEAGILVPPPRKIQKSPPRSRTPSTSFPDGGDLPDLDNPPRLPVGDDPFRLPSGGFGSLPLPPAQLPAEMAPLGDPPLSDLEKMPIPEDTPREER